MSAEAGLTVRDLAVAFDRGVAPPLNVLAGIDLDLAPGERLGIVGESGSGKSTLALALVGLLPAGARRSGVMRFDGGDLLSLDDRAMSRIRGARIGMVFQDPRTALDPAMRIGDQIAEGMRWHHGASRDDARAAALAWLDRVRIPQARSRLDAYPHELSGGQRQRVCIAMALAPGPRLLLADEPTTALDMTVQRDILDLLAELVAERAMALILVSHDLGVVAERTDRVLVLYAGRRMEAGATAAVLAAPAHPYTAALIAAYPRRHAGAERPRRLPTLPGALPDLADPGPGCRFAPRCARAVPACTAAEPDWTGAPDSGWRCIRPRRAEDTST